MQVVLEFLCSCIFWRSTVDSFQGPAPSEIFGYNRPWFTVNSRFTAILYVIIKFLADKHFHSVVTFTSWPDLRQSLLFVQYAHVSGSPPRVSIYTCIACFIYWLRQINFFFFFFFFFVVEPGSSVSVTQCSWRCRISVDDVTVSWRHAAIPAGCWQPGSLHPATAFIVQPSSHIRHILGYCFMKIDLYNVSLKIAPSRTLFNFFWIIHEKSTDFNKI